MKNKKKNPNLTFPLPEPLSWELLNRIRCPHCKGDLFHDLSPSYIKKEVETIAADKHSSDKLYMICQKCGCFFSGKNEEEGRWINVPLKFLNPKMTMLEYKNVLKEEFFNLEERQSYGKC